MSTVRRQAHVAAPLEVVWDLVGDSNRHPQWFPKMAEAGVATVRLFPEWRAIEPEDGTWNWEAADALVDSAAQNGLKISKSQKLRPLPTGSTVQSDDSEPDFEIFEDQIVNATAVRRLKWTEIAQADPTSFYIQFEDSEEKRFAVEDLAVLQGPARSEWIGYLGSENYNGSLIRNLFTKMTTGSSSVIGREPDLFVFKVWHVQYRIVHAYLVKSMPAVAKSRVTAGCGPEAKQSKLQLDTELLTDPLLFPS